MMKPSVRAVAVACALLLPGHVVFAGTVSAHLRADVVVERAEVELGEVAELGGDVAERAAIEHLVVCRAPRVGYVERVTPAAVETVLRRSGRRVAITWDGGAVAQVRSAARRIDGADIANAVLEALRAADDRRELTFAFPRAADGVDVPARAAALRVRPIDAAALMPRMSIWVDVVVDGGVYRTVQVPVDVVREQRVLVARTELRAGTADMASFQAVVRNVVGQQPVAAAELPADAPVRLARPLHAGQVLTADVLMPADGVAPGDRVLVVARAGGAGVEMDGVVVHGGRSGQAVDVLVAHSAQAIAGILLDRHTVSVR